MRLPNLRLATIIASAAVLAFGAAPVAAQPEPTDVRISLWIDSPASIADELEQRLFLDGVDVTDASCGANTTPVNDSRPTLECLDLDEGVYEVRVVGVPEGAATGWICRDESGTIRASDDLVIDPNVERSEYSCFATVSPPGVVIYQLESFTDSEITVLGADGADVTANCTLDVEDPPGRLMRTWCTGLASGSYIATVVDDPDGKVGRIYCDAVIGPSGVADLPGGLGTLTIDNEHPLWSCSGELENPLSFQLTTGGERTAQWYPAGRDLSWADDLSYAVIGSGGNDISTNCPEVDRDVERFLLVTFACTNVEPGEYSIMFDVPAEYRIESTCDPVVVPEALGTGGAFCSVVIESVGDAPTATEPPDSPTLPDPADELPSTGFESAIATAIIGTITLLVGLLLLLASRPERRRRAAHREPRPWVRG